MDTLTELRICGHGEGGVIYHDTEATIPRGLDFDVPGGDGIRHAPSLALRLECMADDLGLGGAVGAMLRDLLLRMAARARQHGLMTEEQYIARFGDHLPL